MLVCTFDWPGGSSGTVGWVGRSIGSWVRRAKCSGRSNRSGGSGGPSGPGVSSVNRVGLVTWVKWKVGQKGLKGPLCNR